MKITRDWLATLPYTAYVNEDGGDPAGRYFRQDSIDPAEVDVVTDDFGFTLVTDVKELGHHKRRIALAIDVNANTYYIVEVQSRTLSRFVDLTIDRFGGTTETRMGYRLINAAVARFNSYLTALEGDRS